MHRRPRHPGRGRDHGLGIGQRKQQQRNLAALADLANILQMRGATLRADARQSSTRSTGKEQLHGVTGLPNASVNNSNLP
ncbi:hypothetical protein ABIF66_008840 [Bradyrhizobium japonicum]